MALADGLIQSGAARRVLLLTAETYSKYIDHDDRSLRTILPTRRRQTLVTAAGRASPVGFQFGSDGSGGDMLLVGDGGSRSPKMPSDRGIGKRWNSRLYMDGPA